jgi:hypothetical protein
MFLTTLAWWAVGSIASNSLLSAIFLVIGIRFKIKKIVENDTYTSPLNDETK